ncbi:MAG: motility associated factor glycosyltransferase family protein [Lachnospiraceae bacterium]|nr:motility associated factor glycosyltransferase family protein [Candidatus Colinaster scatohippi]
MVDFIEDLYKYAELLPFFKQIIEKCYQEEHTNVRQIWDKKSDLVVEFCELICSMDAELGNSLWQQISGACEYSTKGKSGYMLMADGLEAVMPELYKAIGLLGDIDVTEGDYRLFSSKSGFLSLQNIIDDRYFHSTYNPMEEAEKIAGKIYTPVQQNCRILGAGLGYLAYQFYVKSYERFDVYIYEKDENIVNYAKNYGVLSWIPEDRLHIVVEDDEEKLVTAFLEDSEAGFAGKTAYYCSDYIYHRISEHGKELVDKINVMFNTYYTLRDLAAGNFYSNIENINSTVYDIPDEKKADEWIVVGGGPSVDYNIDYLKRNTGKKIIAASTIYGRLIKEGVKVDYIAVLDPHWRTYDHMKDVSDYSATLIVNAVANWKYGKYYLGEKYLVPCFGQECVTGYYRDKDIKLIDTGSTVSSMCIKVAILLGAKRIDLVGMDLAHPKGVSHASGTVDYKVTDSNGLPETDCVAGGRVTSTYQLLFYKEDIEKIIAKESQVLFVNYSNDGALIKGTKWYKDM